MTTLTLQIPERLEVQLDEESKALGISKNDLARGALERLVKLRQIERLRAGLVPFVEKQGILSEADVLQRLEEKP